VVELNAWQSKYHPDAFAVQGLGQSLAAGHLNHVSETSFKFIDSAF
jgi:hypothetical protein